MVQCQPTEFKLFSVATELLAEGEWCGVLGMGSSNLDDVRVLLGLGVNGVMQLLEPWQQKHTQ